MQRDLIQRPVVGQAAQVQKVRAMVLGIGIMHLGNAVFGCIKHLKVHVLVYIVVIVHDFAV